VVKSTLPWRQLLMLAAGVLALASAGLIQNPIAALGLTMAGLALLVLMIRMDGSAPTSLLPRQTRNLRSAAGAGYLTIFLLEGGTSSWGVYGAAMIQAIYRVDPLISGYAVGGVAVGWTVTALSVQKLKAHRHSLAIRIGAGLVTAGLACVSVSMGRAPLLAVAAAAAVLGSGFGLSWSFMGARILDSLPSDERGLGAGAIPTVQMIGAAVGAAGASALGDLLGLGQGVNRASALHAGPLLFAAFIPVVAVGWFTANRLARLPLPASA